MPLRIINNWNKLFNKLFNKFNKWIEQAILKSRCQVLIKKQTIPKII